MAAASEMTRPSRSQSNGRQALAGSGLRESTRKFDQPPSTLPQMGASAPPASTTASSPYRMRRKPSPSATAPEAQAAATVKWLPPSLYWMERLLDSELNMLRGTARGGILRHPRMK